MRWGMTLFNLAKGNRWKIRNRRNNRGMMWLSLLGVGLGGAWAYGMTRDRRNGIRSMIQPIQKKRKNEWDNLIPNL